MGTCYTTKSKIESKEVSKESDYKTIDVQTDKKTEPYSGKQTSSPKGIISRPIEKQSNKDLRQVGLSPERNNQDNKEMFKTSNSVKNINGKTELNVDKYLDMINEIEKKKKSHKPTK
jgi:hypothetical protein